MIDTKMIVVIIAGGSGTRLWPLSTPSYPKHLLKINGDNNSLLQSTYKRARLLTDDIYVVSEAGHIDHVRRQLPALPDSAFIIEPARRGTASCIIAAQVHLKKLVDFSEPIAFLAADHYIRDETGFKHTFKVAADMSSANNRIVLIGVEPDYPATGFGYIEKAELIDEKRLVFNVKSFKEKPDYFTALDYLSSGKYLWNCGYFVGSLNTFEAAMKHYAPKLYKNFQALENASPKTFENVYLGLKNNSIDYELIEKVTDLLVVPAAFDWLDLGSFGDFHKVVKNDELGNHVHGQTEILEVENSLVQNHEDKPLAVIGLDNIVVINTPEGILVARKDLAQKVGEVSKRFKET